MSTDELKKTLLAGLVGVVISGLLVLASYARITAPVQDVFDIIFEPLQTVGLSIDRSLTHFFQNIGAFDRYRSENSALREEITMLRLQSAELEILRSENEYLRKVAGVSLATEDEYLMARVLGYERDIAGTGGIKISTGEADGVYESAIVFASHRALLGKVVAVGRYTSVVETIASPQARIPVKIEGTGALGFWVGERSDGFVVESVDRNAVVPIGANVVTTGEGGHYPPMLLVGTVKSEEVDPASSFKLVIIEPLYELKSINYVLVAK